MKVLREEETSGRIESVFSLFAILFSATDLCLGAVGGSVRISCNGTVTEDEDDDDRAPLTQ